MESKMDENTVVLDTLTEIQTTNKIVLKRLNTIVEEPATCTCSCHSADKDRELKLEQLKQRINALEESLNEKDEQERSLNYQLEALKATLDKLVEERFKTHQHSHDTDTNLPSKKAEEDLKEVLETAERRSNPKMSSHNFESDLPHFPPSDSRAGRVPYRDWGIQVVYGLANTIGQATLGTDLQQMAGNLNISDKEAAIKGLSYALFKDDKTYLDTLTEIQTTNRFVLKRLNTIVQEPTTCTCVCHNEDTDRELEMKQLKQRIKALEESFIEKDEQQKLVNSQLNALKATLDKHVKEGFQAQPHSHSKDSILPSKPSVTAVVNEAPQPVLYDIAVTESHAADAVNETGHGDNSESTQKGRTYLQDVSAETRDVLTGQYPGFENKGADDTGKAVPNESDAPSGDGKENKDTTDYIKIPNEDDTEHKCDGGLNTATTLASTLQASTGTIIGTIANSQGPMTGLVKREQSNAILQSFKESTTSPAKEGSNISITDNNVPHNTTSTKHSDNHKIKPNHKEPVHERYNEPIEKTNLRPLNSLKTPSQDALGVKVVKQREKRTLTSFKEWHSIARKEVMDGIQNGQLSQRGILTVVCLDISQSMAHGNAWEQARTFFTDFIKSLKYSMGCFSIDNEGVALVTFGHKTEVLKRLTNDYSSLQMAFDGLSLGGPSPLYGGLLLSVAAVRAGGVEASVNGIPVRTKFVIITDGHTTDTNLVAGPDEPTPSETDDMTAKIIQVVQKMEHTFDVYVIPVGNANMDFLQMMSTISDGKLLTYRDGKKVGSRLRKTLFASGFGGYFQQSDSDQEDIQEILEAVEKRSNSKRSSYYHESDLQHLPQIGSRVRRGPDWQWDDQDAHGPGTVIGHAQNGKYIRVEWDNNNNINLYRYSATEGFDVLLADEPRLPDAQGRLKVGCIVTPGTEWQQTTRNVKVIDKGVVIKTLENDRVQVRWPNKERGDYSYGLGGKTEVEFFPQEGSLSTGTQHYSSRSYGAQGYTPRIQEATLLTKTPMNKNKNIVHKNKNIKNKNSTNADE